MQSEIMSASKSATLQSTRKAKKGSSRNIFNRSRQGGVQSIEHAKMIAASRRGSDTKIDSKTRTTTSSSSSSSSNRSMNVSRANQALEVNLDPIEQFLMDRDQNQIHQRYSATYSSFEIRKKSKGKKGKKGKKRYTAAPSISSQPSLSSQPSSQPSLSSMPSSEPSSSPTDSPSLHPSSNPTSKPSLHPSLQPSYQPSSIPTSKPSSRPTSQPSSHPSSFPTLQPTSQPSSLPTSQPSIQPSLQPSTSFRPSMSPSISTEPSFDGVTKNESIYDSQNVQIGVKSGCKAPAGVDDARYAEKVLNYVQVRFQYLLYLDENANVDDALKEADILIGAFVFDDYIQCQDDDDDGGGSGNVRYVRNRILQDVSTSTTVSGSYNPHKPMGISSLPVEIENSNLQCAKSKTKNRNNQECVVVDGGVSLIFERDADFNEYLEKYQLLIHLRDAMDDKSLLDYVQKDISIVRSGDGDDTRKGSVIKDMDFVQGMDLEFDRNEATVGRLDRSDAFIQNDKNVLSLAGGLFIAFAALVFVVAIAAVVKRRRTSGFGRRDPDVLRALDEEYEGRLDNNEEDEDGDRLGDLNFPVQLVETRSSTVKKGNKKYASVYSDDDDDLYSTTSHGSKKRRMGGGDHHVGSFPIKLSETRNGRRYPVSRNSLSAYNMRRHTQDVHQCISANCQICERQHGNDASGSGFGGSKIRFVSTSPINDGIDGPFDEIEVTFGDDGQSDRISDRTLDFSKPANMNGRSYDNQDTVHL